MSRNAVLKLMIVDDSLVARTVMTRILADRSEFEIVATASNAAQALALLDSVAVDIILLDVEMPGRDGLSVLPELLAASDGARVLMVSASTADGAEATIRALTEGAADTLLKPAAIDFAGRFAEALIERLLRIGPVVRRAAASAAATPVAVREGARARGPIECIAIGSSTGGPHALTSFFAALPASVTAPILVTQHLPVPFMPYFARQVEAIAGRRTRVAEDGMQLRENEVLIAPGDGHLRLVPSRGQAIVRIDHNPAASGCLPSVDPMLASVSDMFGARGLCVMLSGMGRDGLIGAGFLAQQGGEIYVQDEATSVVWGMPGVVARAGLASAILPPAAIALRVAERCARDMSVAAWR